jgi:hypothetical protein
MIRAQIVNGEPMGTKDIESQVKFLKEDLDFLLLNPESAGYSKIPYDSRCVCVCVADRHPSELRLAAYTHTHTTPRRVST